MATQLVDAGANAFLTDVVQQSTALAALNATNTIQLRGQATCTIQVTAIGTQTLTFEVSTDGTNFTGVNAYPVTNTGVPITTTTTTGHWQVVVAGFYQFRVRCSAFTSGSATVSMVAAQGTNEQQLAVGSAIASTTAGQLGQLVQGAVTTAAPAYTTAQTDPLSLTTAGALRTDVNSIIGTTAVAASAGVLKVGVAGNAGAAFDGAIAAVPPANAVQIGYKAATANPTNATAGNQVAPLSTLAGSLVTTPYNNRTLVKHQATAVAVNTETTIITAGGAGVFNDLLTLIVTTAAATAGTLTIRDVTAAGTPFIINYPNAALAPADPLVILLPVPMQQGTAASAWTITNSQAVAINVTAQYVQRLA